MDTELQKMMDLWELQQQKQIDPSTITGIQKDIQNQVGATGNNHAKVDPKAVVNKAVTNAASKDPAGVTQLLNDKNTPKMKKKMKKEHLLTFEEFKANFKPHPEDEDGFKCKKCKKKPCTCPRKD
jgi:acyl-CoA hydrolase